MFSGDEIRKLAEVQVWNNKLYNESAKPVDHGILDARMVHPVFIVIVFSFYFVWFLVLTCMSGKILMNDGDW